MRARALHLDLDPQKQFLAAYQNDLIELRKAGCLAPSSCSSHGIALRLLSEPMTDACRARLTVELHAALWTEIQAKLRDRDAMVGVYAFVVSEIMNHPAGNA